MSLKSKLVGRALAALTFFTVVVLPALAFAADDKAANKFDADMGLAIGAGIAIGAAALGGAIGQGRAAAAALEGIARNPGAAPRIQTPMILGLALIESLVLLAWVMALFLWNKIQM